MSVGRCMANPHSGSGVGGRLSSFKDDQKSAGCLTAARRQVQEWQGWLWGQKCLKLQHCTPSHPLLAVHTRALAGCWSPLPQLGAELGCLAQGLRGPNITQLTPVCVCVNHHEMKSEHIKNKKKKGIPWSPWRSALVVRAEHLDSAVATTVFFYSSKIKWIESYGGTRYTRQVLYNIDFWGKIIWKD